MISGEDTRLNQSDMLMIMCQIVFSTSTEFSDIARIFSLPMSLSNST